MLAKVQVLLLKRSKLDPKTINCVLIGYASYSVVYKFLVTKSEIPDINANIVLKSIEMEFFENIFPFQKDKASASGSKRTYEASSSKGQDGQEIDIEPRRSKRPRKAYPFDPYFLTFVLEDKPQTYGDTMLSLDAHFFKKAINSEMDSILQNNTWVLVNLPPGCKPVGCR